MLFSTFFQSVVIWARSCSHTSLQLFQEEFSLHCFFLLFFLQRKVSNRVKWPRNIGVADTTSGRPRSFNAEKKLLSCSLYLAAVDKNTQEASARFQLCVSLLLYLSFTSLRDPTIFSVRVRVGKLQSLIKLKGFSANSWILKNLSRLIIEWERRPPAGVPGLGKSESRVAEHCMQCNFIYESQQNYCFRHSGRGCLFQVTVEVKIPKRQMEHFQTALGVSFTSVC